MKELTKDQFVFAEFCKNSKKVIDVGAQRGDFIHYANKNMNNGVIYGLEPDPKYLKTLNSIRGANENKIVISNFGASSKREKLKLYNTNTGCVANVKMKAKGHCVIVDLDTLDNLFPFEVDLIKIDVEAYEYEVLLGCRNHIKRGTPFYVEIHHNWLIELGKSKDDIIKIFEDAGYESNFLHKEECFADLYYYMFIRNEKDKSIYSDIQKK
jgi:FkbM family methyltransferase